MERLTAATPYVLGEEHGLRDVLAVEAELLRSEGLDPEWPGFDRKPPRESD